MCGRFGFAQDKSKIKTRFKLKKVPANLLPLYNIAPQQQIPVILNESVDALTMARWGLIPHWSPDEKPKLNLINARAETIAQKPIFKSLLKTKRCLILADAFYEWKKTDEGKQPFRILLNDEEPFAFAGIWDLWQKGDKQIVSVCIITTSPNSLMKGIHERMPVILKPANERQWLNGDEVISLLKPYDAKQMKAYPISKAINNPSNQDKELIERI